MTEKSDKIGTLLKIVVVILALIITIIIIQNKNSSVTAEKSNSNNSETNENSHSALTKMTKGDIKFNDDRINIYVFWGDGCPHCEDLSEYLSTLDQKYQDMYDLYTFEVWSNEENLNFYYEMADIMNADVDGIPFVIIGDKYFEGFTIADKENLIPYITAAYNSEEKIDYYQKLLESTN